MLGTILNFFRTVSPVKALLYAAALNGVIAPPLLVLLLLLYNWEAMVGTRRNGPRLNVLGRAVTAVMTAAAVIFFWSLATGKAFH